MEKERNNTLQYYNDAATQFCETTREVEFTDTQERFLKYLAAEARVLDFGCGSGRDTKYFISRGFRTDAIDGSEELVRLASEYTGIEVKQMLFQELNAENVYDGIWACASVLHLNHDELTDIFCRIERALTSRGILYVSFKYGDGDLIRNGRYFTDMTEEKVKRFPVIDQLFDTEEMWKTVDARPGRAKEEWLNLILRKKN